MELPMAPEVLLKETYTYILEHPEEHNQRLWQTFGRDCGTAYCFAGMAVHLAGLEMNRNDHVCGKEWENAPHINDVARKILGLEEDQAGQLFNAGNSIDDIRRLLENWGML